MEKYEKNMRTSLLSNGYEEDLEEGKMDNEKYMEILQEKINYFIENTKNINKVSTFEADSRINSSS